MKLWIVETFKDGKWRLLAYPNGYGDFAYSTFPVREEAGRWRKRRIGVHGPADKYRFRRVELPGVEG